MWEWGWEKRQEEIEKGRKFKIRFGAQWTDCGMQLKVTQTMCYNRFVALIEECADGDFPRWHIKQVYYPLPQERGGGNANVGVGGVR